MVRTLTALLILAAAVSTVVSAQSDPTVITPFAAAAETTKLAGPPPAIRTAIIFRTSCRRCHGSDRPAIGLSLKPETFADAMVDVPSREIKELMLVDTKNPEKSYLLMKIRGDEGIVGERMPIGSEALSDQGIAVVEAWVREVSARAAADTSPVAEPESGEAAGVQDDRQAPAALEAKDEVEVAREAEGEAAPPAEAEEEPEPGTEAGDEATPATKAQDEAEPGAEAENEAAPPTEVEDGTVPAPDDVE